MWSTRGSQLLRLAALLLALTGTAQAQESPPAGPPPSRAALEQARQAFERGVVRFRNGDAAAALTEFERSYALVPEAGVLYNLGLVQKTLGRLALASRTLRLYLERARGIGAERRSQIRQILTELRGRVGELQVQGLPAGTRVTLDGAPVGVAPLGPQTVDPGWHVIEAEPPSGSPAPGRRRRLQVSPGSRLVLDFDGPTVAAPVPLVPVDPAASAARSEASSAPPPFYRRWWFWTLVGVAVAGSVAGGVIASQRGGDAPTGNLGPGSFTFR